MTYQRWHHFNSKELKFEVSGGAFLIEKSEKPLCLYLGKSTEDFCLQEFKVELERLTRSDKQTLSLKFIGSQDLLKSSPLKEYSFTRFIKREGQFQLVYSPLEKKLKVSSSSEVEQRNPSHSNQVQNKIKVLIVDDSKTIRTILTKVFSSDPSILVLGACASPLEVEDFIKKQRPDVMTLDIHMPEMDGVTLLKKLMPIYHIPTVMISSISKEEGPQVLEALEAGAIDYIQKPKLDDLEEASQAIVQSIKMAAAAKMQSRKISRHRIQKVSIDQTKVVLIGSSTGGTEALRSVFEQLPSEIPPILIVQHIPAVFSAAFADRLNSICPFHVKEAKSGDLVVPNQVLIAPGGQQMGLKRHAGGLKVIITDDPPVNRHKPSVDYLFDSACELDGFDWVSVILTGMGADGAKAMARLRKRGARTIAQDEQSSVVYGMPREAVRAGGVEFVLPLEQVAEKIIELTANSKMFKVS